MPAHQSAGRCSLHKGAGCWIGCGVVCEAMTAPAGVITTVVGNGNPGFSGDGGSALAAQLRDPIDVAVDATGKLLIVDYGNNRIRRATVGGTITGFAGNGSYGPNGDGGLATAAQLNDATGVTADVAGNVFIADRLNNRVRKVAGGIIDNFAGTGVTGTTGDGGPALAAQMNTPSDVVVDSSGTVFIADTYNNRIRAVKSGTISTVAGNGVRNFSGDGGPATAAAIGRPNSVGIDNSGGLVIADSWNRRVRTVAATGASYHPVTPQRILDSRVGNGFSGPVVAGTPRQLAVGGTGPIPANASAVVMNVTITGGTAASFLSVWPAGAGQPNSSNLNFGPGETIPNLVTVKLGAGGNVSIANAVGATQVIADVVGYYDDGTGVGDLFNGITPKRLLDSRTATGGWNAKLAAGTPRDLQVRQPGNAAGVPSTATSIVANVTVTSGNAGSFLSVWPSGVTQPNVSNLNFGANQTIPNLVTVKIGSNNAIRFANAVGSVDVVVDVVGYFDPTGGARFHAIAPTRILDDRVSTGLPGPWGPAQTRTLAVAGVTGSNVPAGATGLVANLTATGGTAGSFVTVFPDGVAKPNSSNLNFGPGQTIPNLVTVKLAANGNINLYNELGTVDLIADVVGYYSAI